MIDRRFVVHGLVLVFAVLGTAGCVAYVASGPRPVELPPPPPPPPVPAQEAGIDVGSFYDDLDPYGDWIWVDPYGWVWSPSVTDTFWRPYTMGRWVSTDWGWTWVSDEPWGWAVYHYGRWVRHPHHGWVWMPGTEWGPAWVAWRSGGGVVGWAPLPPEVSFRAGVGIDLGGVNLDVVIQRDTWCFVDEPHFIDPGVSRWAYPVARNRTFWGSTRDATRIRVVDRRVVNDGPDWHEVERVTRRPLPQLHLVDAPSAVGRKAEVVGNDVRVFRPPVRAAKPGAAPRRGIRIEQAAPPKPVVAPPQPPADKQQDKRFDQGWKQDWNKLQKAQKKDERDAARTGSPAPTVLLEQHRNENYDAAENARREQVAAQERAKRKAEKAPAAVKKNEARKEDPEPPPDKKKAKEKPDRKVRPD